MVELNGEKTVNIQVRKEEAEILSALKANGVRLNDLIENQEEYIKTLEDALHDAIFKLEDIQYIALMEKEKAKKVRDYHPLRITDMEGEEE